MQVEISPDIRLETPEEGTTGWSTALFVAVRKDDVDIYDPATIEQQIEWYALHLDRFVNYVRPLVKQLPK